jgi:hypothetical protein
VISLLTGAGCEVRYATINLDKPGNVVAGDWLIAQHPGPAPVHRPVEHSLPLLALAAGVLIRWAGSAAANRRLHVTFPAAGPWPATPTAVERQTAIPTRFASPTATALAPVGPAVRVATRLYRHARARAVTPPPSVSPTAPNRFSPRRTPPPGVDGVCPWAVCPAVPARLFGQGNWQGGRLSAA